MSRRTVSARMNVVALLAAVTACAACDAGRADRAARLVTRLLTDTDRAGALRAVSCTPHVPDEELRRMPGRTGGAVVRSERTTVGMTRSWVGAPAVYMPGRNAAPPGAPLMIALWAVALLLFASGCFYVWQAAGGRAAMKRTRTDTLRPLVVRQAVRGVGALIAAIILGTALAGFP